MQIKRIRIIRDLVMCIGAFALTVAFAIFWKWQATDLIWGLWLSSLCVGFVLIVAPIVSSVFRSRGTVHSGRTIEHGFFLVGFNVFLFGLAHFFIGLIFYHFFPPPGVPESRLPNTENTLLILLAVLKCPVKLLMIMLRLYWPIVLATAIARFDEFRAAATSKKNDLSNETRRVDLWKPYGSVARMFALISVLGILPDSAYATPPRGALYVVLFFYFFPWGKILGDIDELDKSAATSEERMRKDRQPD